MIKNKNYLFLIILCLCISIHCFGQDAAFFKSQISFVSVSTAWRQYHDTVVKAFRKKGLEFPSNDIFLRAFKSQNELELWARNSCTEEYKLVKTFSICALSGELGPKRKKGDLQVPEGFYFIDEFNPKSRYKLSLLVSYPNFADEKSIKAAGFREDMGGDIYVHGGCVTIGCVPLGDIGIQQMYVICLAAKSNGQMHIPIHIYPSRYTKNAMNYLKKEYPGDLDKLQFWNTLKEGYDYFEKYHVLMPVMYTGDGKYVY